tara:strand:- start:48 stop:1235 length:1188 start_codon:yes stop_codon:yes gene_type:complete
MKIAIYSGEIPSTNFIENTIFGLSSNIRIFLFGKRKSKNLLYPKNVKLFLIPKGKIKKIIYLLYQLLILFLCYPHRLFTLFNSYLKIKKVNKFAGLNWWIKALPVVNNLPDIFHIQWAKSLSSWFFLKEDFNVKIIVSLRGAHINYSPISDPKLRDEYLRYFPMVDQFHAVSDAIAKECLRYGADIDKINLIYSGVNLSKLKEVKKSYILQSPVQILSVGRYHWKKGYHYALFVLKKLLSNNENIRYTIISSNKPSDEILFIVDDLDLGNHVRFDSYSSQSEVYYKMEQVDFLLLPSVEEGIANVVLESMAIGLPVISSDCGGMDEVIKDGDNGLLFESRNQNQMYSKIIDYLDFSEDQRFNLATNAKNHIIKYHSLENHCIMMEKLFEKCMSFK